MLRIVDRSPDVDLRGEVEDDFRLNLRQQGVQVGVNDIGSDEREVAGTRVVKIGLSTTA